MTARDRLARQQAALLGSLVAGADAPPGFDVDRLATQRTALRAKRSRAVAGRRPDLRIRLADRYRELFDSYARAHPKTDGQRSGDDAAAFEAWLLARAELPPPPPVRRWLRSRRRD